MKDNKPKITFSLRYSRERKPGEGTWKISTDLDQPTPLEGETPEQTAERLRLVRLNRAVFSRPEVKAGLLVLLAIVLFVGVTTCMLIGEVLR